MRRGEGALLLLLLISACSVPKLTELGEKRCDTDAGHACITGYACQGGFCRIPAGMPCTEGQTKACGTDIGECVRGTQRCVQGVFGECEGAVGPATESCDNKDNDCDDSTDEDLAAVAPACEKQDGVCMGKKKTCVAGSYVATCGPSEYGTDFQADETRCDGQDNDCDGATDEGVGGGACANAGICIGFQRACTMGAPGVCLAPGFEPTEVSCDNQDNDCDGTVDEGIVSSTPCTLTQGVCQNKFAACRNGNIESTCTQASYGPTYEAQETSCDGMDNDCDGITDRLTDGGFVRIGTCELSQGVCANARRACIAGNGEAPCTAASYGPFFEVSEASCDSLDNDCDGRVDVSSEVTLLATPNTVTNHISLAASSMGGSAAVYADERRGTSRVIFRRFDDQLRAAGNEFELSDPSATDAIRPSLVRIGLDYAVVWMETVGTPRIVLARVADNGTVAWSRVVASNVSVFKDPKVAASSSGGSNVAVAWIGSNLVLQGVVYDGTGSLTVPAKQLVAAPDAGGDLIFGLDLVRRQATNDFLVGWVAQNAGTFRVRFRAFDDTLTGQGTLREEFTAGETADAVRVAIAGDTGEVSGAWLGSNSTMVSTLRWLPNAISSPMKLVANTFNGTSADLTLATTAGGVAAFWAQGGTTARLVGTALGGDGGVRDFTPQGVTGLFAPGVTSLDGGVLQVGYEADRGMGLDLFGQVICRP